MTEDEVDELDDSAFDFEWDEVSGKTFRPKASARHFYSRGYQAALDKQTQLINALRSEAFAANELLNALHWWTSDDDITNAYDRYRGARLKLEDEMKAGEG